MLKLLLDTKDLGLYQESMAEKAVEYYKKEWGVLFQKKKISSHLLRIIKMTHTFAILDLEGVRLQRFLLAYPAQYCQYFSCIPENTISIYVDFIDIDNQLWAEFLKNMERCPFRNVFRLGLPGTDSFDFFEKESFKAVGRIRMSARPLPFDENLREKSDLVVTKKILNLFKYGGGK